MAYKQVRVTEDDHELLTIIAEEEKRSVSAQLSVELQKIRAARLESLEKAGH